MPSLLIVFHSRTGGARSMARAAARGAAEHAPGVAVRTLEADEAQAHDLLAADAYVFACPENLASMSGAMKEFFDRSYYDVLGRIEGRPYALMICAGTDGTGAARQVERIVTGWRLRRIREPAIIRTGAQTGEQIWQAKVLGEAELALCFELGATLAAGLEGGIY